LIFVPLQLGVDRVHSRYERQLSALLRVPQCVGVVAGEPSRAYYVVGAQADTVFYLDPHYVQPYAPVRASDANHSVHTAAPRADTDVSFDNDDNDGSVDGTSNTSTYHSVAPRTVAIASLAPSLLTGFYCESESSWRRLTERLEMLSQASEPIISVVEKHAADIASGRDLSDSLRKSDELLASSIVMLGRQKGAGTDTKNLSLSADFGVSATATRTID